jgi:Flp pilus assembly protein TadG
MTRISGIVRRGRRLVAGFARDKRGVAAVEFVFIVPLMLALTFGTIEVSSAVAIDRKVTLVARTLSDLVSQGSQVTQTDLKNFFGLGSAIMTPYPVTAATLTQKISAVNIDASKKVTVVWSYSGAVSNGVAATPTVGYAKGAVVTSDIPPGLLVPNTQLIWSEVVYTYKPVSGFFMISKDLTDECFTRPRQSDCVMDGTTPCTVP